ncbi:MAG: hypothetical protein WC812_02790 [Candidatus Pacearchaeota archaeon]
MEHKVKLNFYKGIGDVNLVQLEKDILKNLSGNHLRGFLFLRYSK